MPVSYRTDNLSHSVVSGIDDLHVQHLLTFNPMQMLSIFNPEQQVSIIHRKSQAEIVDYLQNVDPRMFTGFRSTMSTKRSIMQKLDTRLLTAYAGREHFLGDIENLVTVFSELLERINHETFLGCLPGIQVLTTKIPSQKR